MTSARIKVSKAGRDRECRMLLICRKVAKHEQTVAVTWERMVVVVVITFITINRKGFCVFVGGGTECPQPHMPLRLEHSVLVLLT